MAKPKSLRCLLLLWDSSALVIAGKLTGMHGEIPAMTRQIAMAIRYPYGWIGGSPYILERSALLPCARPA